MMMSFRPIRSPGPRLLAPTFSDVLGLMGEEAWLHLLPSRPSVLCVSRREADRMRPQYNTRKNRSYHSSSLLIG